MNALRAYRTLTAKRNKGIALNSTEEQQLLDEEQALGQKMAFDMESLRGNAPVETPQAAQSKAPTTQKAVQQSMDLGSETLTDGQMTLFDVLYMEQSQTGENFISAKEIGLMESPSEYGGNVLASSPSQRGVDYAVTKSILDGSYERTEADTAAARAFARAIRQDDELRGAFGERPPRDIGQRLPRESRTWKTSAAILSELSGKRLISYTPQSDVASNGVTVPKISSSVFVSTSAPSIPATASHEAWHRLRIDHPRDAAMIGGLLQESIDSVLLETAQDAYRKYPPTQRAEEVAANIFSTIVADPAFWREYGTPNSEAIAEELEKASVPAYYEARLVRDWPELVKGTAQILRGESAALLSSPTPSNDPAIQLAIDKMPPIFRSVFADITSGMSPAEVAAKNGIQIKGVENIVLRLEAYLGVVSAAAADTLTPTMKDGLIDDGRPDLAFATNHTVAAVKRC
jgi:hypothetical protein